MVSLYMLIKTKTHVACSLCINTLQLSQAMPYVPCHGSVKSPVNVLIILPIISILLFILFCHPSPYNTSEEVQN